MTKTTISQLSGRQFADLLQTEVEAANRGLGRLSYEELGRSCGFSGKWLRKLAKEPGNPSSLTIRSVLLTLGYEVSDPDQDVLPHLIRKGCFSEDLHGPARRRRQLTASDVPASSRSREATS